MARSKMRKLEHAHSQFVRLYPRDYNIMAFLCMQRATVIKTVNEK